MNDFWKSFLAIFKDLYFKKWNRFIITQCHKETSAYIIQMMVIMSNVLFTLLGKEASKQEMWTTQKTILKH